ncbi:gamma-glutamylcyclotransferase [Oceanicola sp. 22II-s10i]|uniref:gamma-glutamylcyclotransferase n=1 Tax=Oceanicola sp. 22II-s10i TaxID=1317116 RepID=UPI001595E044|nr:gamma-glutamylcyclotransferase [Oceanicola sp. 22II-s10i]
MKRTIRLTQDLVDRLPPTVDSEGPITISSPDDAWYDRTAAAILDQLGPDEPLWVFAIGSLIWNPRFPDVERRSAYVEGWRRSFCLGPSLRNRGSPERPGMMLALEAGGECWGVAIRMRHEDRHEALPELLKKEPPNPPGWVDAMTDEGPIRCIAFHMEPTFPRYCQEPEPEELADILANAVGTRGTMADYLLRTAIELEKAGIHDPHIWRLQEMVAERLERLEPPDAASPEQN